ncbi:hypothetical protein EM20IM_04365 [Candidatus Methylacidiphilum infernorum]|uniref:Uncharacterized protein n=1 Tax=Candidatus Methylacidiphilum infernorum TaxID=511746 RepID=A0ABX7PY26_9BACT|nr:hypothetical protein EM20IM_04365 [Candidatus Methylacidiphilum infernorum]
MEAAVSEDDENRFSLDDLNIKVQQAQEILLDLERRKEEIERQKKQLEELRQKQRTFEEGHKTTVDLLTRGLVLLERQAGELKRQLEEIETIHTQFSEQLKAIENIQPSSWDPMNLEDELNKALVTIEQAKSIYTQYRDKLGVNQEKLDEEEEEEVPFQFWNKVLCGFAYSLPLILVLLAGLVIWVLKK